MHVVALVAAAGRSGRMGSPKALLPFGHDVDAVSFVARIIAVCRAAGIDDVVVSVPDGDDGDAVRAVVGDARTITNPWPQLGISGSIIAALDSAAATELEEKAASGFVAERASSGWAGCPRQIGIDALLLWPVDAPFADATVVRALIDALENDDDVDAAVALTPAGRGHPVLLRATTFAAIRAHADDGGPRRVLDRVRVHEVVVDDDRLALNLNTPMEWQRAFDVDR